MPRFSVRRACAENAGILSFLRRRHGSPPCICVEDVGDQYDSSGEFVDTIRVWKWIHFEDLGADNFIKYRDKITQGIKELQSERRRLQHLVQHYPRENFIYEAPPMERALLKQIFNHHLTDEEKKRYIEEFSNTIIASQNCSGCLGVVLDGKKKCLHYNCPGMCGACYEKMGNKCPICEKTQVATCPICKEDKLPADLCHHANNKHFARCGHPVCWQCMGKAYVSGHPIVKCPLCRVPWVQHRVAGEPSI